MDHDGTRTHRSAPRRRAGLRTLTACAAVLPLLALGMVLLTGGAARADTAQIAPFPRRDVIPAPGVNFVRVGDLDGDQRVDFAGLDSVYDRGTGTVIEVRLRWWRQEPAGAESPPGSTFSSAIDVRGAPRDADLQMGVGDLDGDGHDDLLTVDPNGQTSAWLNPDGAGAFDRRTGGGRVLTGVGYIAIANVDADSGDARDDLLVVRDGRDVTWYPSVGDAGAFDLGRGRTLLRGSEARKVIAVSAGDLNGDGLLDLATATDKTGDTITWWHQVVEGDERRFEHAGEGEEADVRDLAIGDIDGDGDGDIVVTAQVGARPYHVTAWLNGGDGTTFERVDTPLHQGTTADQKWNAIDIADVNRDRALDFVASEFTEGSGGGRLCWYQNPGGATPTVEPSPTMSATATPTASSTGSPPPDPTATPGGPTTTPLEATVYLPLARAP